MARILFFLSLLCVVSYGFPEMVRHGYANCMTCHYSPTGGGLLTDYGRALAAEALSWKGGETEGAFLYGILPETKPVVFGGDVRWLQNYQSLNHRSTFKFIPMQADLETGVDLQKFAFVGTAGVDYDGKLISRRHYALYHFLDKFVVRAGKFTPAYGVNTENHTIGIKRGIGRDQGSETYNVEASWVEDGWDLFVTGILGRPDDTSLGAEGGAALSSSIFLNKKYKVGVSYYYGARDIEQRHLAGPFAILGFTKRFFVMLEADFQWFRPKIGSQQTKNGFVDYIRADYEVFQGLHVYVTQQYAALDLAYRDSTGNDAYGVGLQFFPRPHFEFNLQFQKLRYAGSTDFGDFAFALFHYYL